jgi:molybdate transport system substrate-binding protein
MIATRTSWLAPAARWAACVLAAAACGCSGGSQAKSASGNKPLLCHVGGTMKPVMEKLAKDYEAACGQKVLLNFADSGVLLINIETAKKGDLLVCHDPFGDMLMRKGLGKQSWTVAVVSPVIVVPKGNPRKLHTIKDLGRSGLKLCLTDPNHSTLGHVMPRIFDKAGVRKQIEANVVTRVRGGGEAANKVALGDVDAAIVWNAVAFLRQDKLDIVPIAGDLMPISGVDAVTSATGRSYDVGRIKVTLATLSCAEQGEAAAKFAEYVFAHRDVFAGQFGYTAAPAEAAQPSLHAYIGAGLRSAMEDAAAEFGKAAGVKVQTDYAGSGMLISRVKLGRNGDIFMPGDEWYLDQVEKEGLLASRKMVACFVPVIIVQKGNPKGIQALKDLLAPGVRLAMGDPKACQIGRLTQDLLVKNQLDPKAAAANTAFSRPTVNELAVQVQMKSADAAIVWDAVAAEFARDVDVIAIPPAQNIVSNVAVGVLKQSGNKALADKFIAFLAGEEGKAIFRKHHYTAEAPK